MEITNRSQSIFMAIYSKESLDALRQKINLVEVISSYVPMGRSGSAYKGLCPFHDESTPSFMVQKGDSHYHCFGCGAHGDAIAFLMQHLKMTFVEALEYLAEKFQVSLEKVEEDKGPNKKKLKHIMERASAFYRFFLLHSEEGKEALDYLYQREMHLPFIEKFEIGYAPKQGDMLYKLLKAEGFSEEELQLVGLLRIGSTGRRRDFFSERIVFPIRDRVGSVIGFSARKIKEETFGGKYINTPETPLFKKSHTLFGFCYSRHRIAKERKALIVEGQIDALRLIFNGFDFTVASQGTAFGEGHAKELLSLGVSQVYLAFDADRAGQEATIKVGNLFQSDGVEAICITLPQGSDPDTFIQEHGEEAFSELLSRGVDYLTFYYRALSSMEDMSSPSKKNEIIETMVKKIRSWDKPVLVHESLKKLASLANLPQGILGTEAPIAGFLQTSTLAPSWVDADRVLEMDLLRWLFLSIDPASTAFQLIQNNLSASDFKVPVCADLFRIYFDLEPKERGNWLAIASQLKKKEEQDLLNKLLQKKVNKQRSEECILDTVKKILMRNWMDLKEAILTKMKDVNLSEEDMLLLVQEFDTLNKNPPKVST